MDRRNKVGWLYFVQAIAGGFIKIGYTGDAQAATSRISGIQGMCPIPLRCLGTLRGSLTDEEFLHFKFADSCVYGEWFEPTEELLEFIASRCDKSSFFLAPYPRKNIKLTILNARLLENVKITMARDGEIFEETVPEDKRQQWRAIARNKWTRDKFAALSDLAREIFMEHLEN